MNSDITIFEFFEGYSSCEKNILALCSSDVAQEIIKIYDKRHCSPFRSLPKLSDILSISSELLCKRGLTIENLYIYAKAVCLAWQKLNWLCPNKYFGTENADRLLHDLLNCTCNSFTMMYLTDNHIMSDGFRAYSGSRQVVLFIKEDDNTASFEVFPTRFRRKCFLSEQYNEYSLYVFPGENYSLKLRENDIVLIYPHDDGPYIESVISPVDARITFVQQSNFYEQIAQLKATLTKPKIDAEEIISYLKQNGVDYFYHFTDIRNLALIKQYGGLFSWKYLASNNIDIPNAGGNNRSQTDDTYYSNQDYVHLSFCKDHPMLYRKQKEEPGSQFVLLKISIEVATFETTLFSTKNATAHNHHEGASLAALSWVNISDTKKTKVQHFLSDGSTNPAFEHHQAEIMCKTMIPAEMIINLDEPINL